VFQSSPLFGAGKDTGAKDMLLARVRPELAGRKFNDLSEQEQRAALADMATLPKNEKLIAASLVRRSGFQLSKALAPLLGQETANLVFGFGIFGMGFSTIIILMLINGFVFREAAGKPQGGGLFAAGCLVAGVAGALWPLAWDGPARLWLAVLASSFGMMLLPIAYVTFFMMMNSRAILGDQRPRGLSRLIWNALMGVSVFGAIVAAGAAIYGKITDKSNADAELAGQVVLGGVVLYGILVAIGFALQRKPDSSRPLAEGQRPADAPSAGR
jgi:hypothetical protein